MNNNVICLFTLICLYFVFYFTVVLIANVLMFGIIAQMLKTLYIARKEVNNEWSLLQTRNEGYENLNVTTRNFTLR